MVKTLGQRIRELREEADLSLREFSQKLGGLSPAFLSDIELGRRNPSDKVLVLMAAALGTTADDLRTYDPRPAFEELRRLASENPAYGFAFRKLLDKKLSPDELMRMLDKEKQGKKEKP